MALVREYRQGDDEAVREVIRIVYDEYGFGWDPEGYHADIYDIPRYYQTDDCRMWVAENDEGKVVGCCALEWFPPRAGERGSVAEVDGTVRVCGADCEIHRLYVHPDARRLGLGRALTDAVINHAKQIGREYMEIWTDFKLTKAHALYQSYGAQVVGERICAPPDETPEYGMILPLQN